MMITPIQSRNVSDEILEQIKSNILAGEWLPGDKLPGELALSELFGVSRISVRQAIHRLVGMGLLCVRRGEGTFVREIIPADYFENLLPMLVMDLPQYNEVQEFRLVFEPSVAKMAAIRATDEDLEALRASVERLGTLEGNREAYAREDVHFHSTIAYATKNALIIKTEVILSDLVSTAMAQAVRIVGFADGVNYHRKIYEYIRDRRGDEVAELVRDHIRINLVDLADGEQE